jgi:hypothetical protein
MSEALVGYEACLEVARSLSVAVRLIPFEGAACSSILDEYLEVKVEVMIRDAGDLFAGQVSLSTVQEGNK